MSEITEGLALLVSVCEKSYGTEECYRSLDELERLLTTAGGKAFAKVVQIKDSPDPRTVIGSGKVKELSELAHANGVGLVIFDFELSPMQIRNLEEDIGEVTVLDRSMLILDIFALHAETGEGKLQVELAQLRYTAPRLTGKGTELSRQGGGIGSRGPGESKLETDRRHLHEKIEKLEAKLAELERNRSVMRERRDRSGIPKIALVGYTNAGKSTLLNALTGAGVLCEDKLFATLDPTTRKLVLPGGETVLLTDTVGFIRKLPHHLVRAFRSTLDEVRYADVLLIVSDVTDPEVPEHLAVTEEVIRELGAGDKPRIYVYNKCDALDGGISYAVIRENTIAVSAKGGLGLDVLLGMIEDEIRKSKRKLRLLIPYAEQSAVSSLYSAYNVESTSYDPDGVRVVVTLDRKGAGQFEKYIEGVV